MPTFTRKKQIIEAIKFDRFQWGEILQFTNGRAADLRINNKGCATCIFIESRNYDFDKKICNSLKIRTLHEGDYLIKIDDDYIIFSEKQFEELYKPID
jgi:hypothetical protein